MAAGLSKDQISSRVRRRLQNIADHNRGTYVAGKGNRPNGYQPPRAEGVTEDGLHWTARFHVSNMSNGETVGYPLYSIRADDGPVRAWEFNGLEVTDLSQALRSVRAQRIEKLAYVVMPGGRACDQGYVGAENVTLDLGKARWAQQQTGNVFNLWEVEVLSDDGKVRFLREFPFTSKVGHEAMHAYITHNGLNIYDAQKTRFNNPALPSVADAFQWIGA